MFASPAQSGSWAAKEIVKYYDVSGDTGRALYESIGAKGPKLKNGNRAIGLMEYDLKWRRDYQPEMPAPAQAGQNKKASCRLASAEPLLTITYRLPRAKPPKAVSQRWQTFTAGIEAHERTHGAHVKDMVDAILADTVGLVVEGDSDCAKTRATVLTRVKAALDAYLKRTRAFEKEEMGGNVRRLIVGLVE